MKYFLNLVFLFIVSLSCLSQSYNASRIYGPVSITGPDSSILEQSLIGWHQVSWVVTGTPGACTVKVEQSPDNATWTDLIANQTCTSAGSSAISANLLPYYIRINVTALSGGSSPTIIVIYEGWASNPNPAGSGGGSVTQGTVPWADNITQVAGVTLGATAVVAYGSGTPAAVNVPAVNAAINSIAGTPVVTAGAGVQKVGINGNSLGSTLDATLAAGAAPNNGLGVLAQYNTSAVTPTNTQTAGLQSNAWGAVNIRPFRRNKTVCTPTTIASSSSPTTVMAAQGAATFADISNLVITVVPAATVDLAFTATLSDGTQSFVYDMDTGALATAPADPTIVNVEFNPPMAATSANTAWTITLNVATVTVHITTCAVDEK